MHPNTKKLTPTRPAKIGSENTPPIVTEKPRRPLSTAVVRPTRNKNRSVRRIMLPTDFSTASRRAYAHAAHIARHFDAMIYLVHIGRARAPEYSGISNETHLKGTYSDLRKECRRDEFADMKIDFRLLCNRNVSRSLENFEQEMNCDLVVTTTPAHRGWKQFSSICYTNKIFSNSTVPVWLIGPGSESYSVRSPKRVLVPFDFSDKAVGTLPLIRFLSNHYDCAFKLVCIQKAASEKSWYEKLLSRKACRRKTLEKRFGQLLDKELAGVEVELEIADGEQQIEAVKQAREIEADLVIIGTHGTLDKVSLDIVRDAHCPVVAAKSEALSKFHHW